MLLILVVVVACGLLFPSQIPSRAVRQEQDDGNDTHQSDDPRVKPECLYVPCAKNFLTTIERSPAEFVVWRQVNDA